jgi:hypothetical protein
LIATPGLARPAATTRAVGPARAKCRALPASAACIENERAYIVNESVDTFDRIGVFRTSLSNSGARFDAELRNSGLSPTFPPIA